DLFQQRFRKLVIHVAIVPEVVGTKNRARMRYVAERPDALIRETIIEAALLFASQPNAAQGVLRMIGRYPDVIEGIHSSAIGVAGAWRDPHAVAGAQNRLQAGDQTACRHFVFDTVGTVSMLVRFAIGDSKKPRAAKPVFDEDPEPFGGPGGVGGL